MCNLTEVDVPDFPAIRDSVLMRLRDPRDAEAWGQFVRLYQPPIYRMARARGLQDADASDLCQFFQLVVSREATFGNRLKAACGVEFDEFTNRFDAWRQRVSR